TAKTLGNMGWCYHRMGDDAKALSLSSDAKEAATQLGVSKDEMLWLRNIGIIEDSQGSYTAAERDYEDALDLANKMQDGAEAATCLNNLAIVKLKRREYGRAEQ